MFYTNLSSDMKLVYSGFIPGNVPSSKNSKRWTGKMLISSKQVMNYKADTENFWIYEGHKFRKAVEGLEPPLKVSFYFIRDSRRKFDFINPAQTVQDQMVRYEWIPDDNMTEIVPIFEGYEVDKENPGVHIKAYA